MPSKKKAEPKLSDVDALKKAYSGSNPTRILADLHKRLLVLEKKAK